MIRMLLISGGIVSLAMGITGIFVPVLPTTPFLLLSTGLFVKSSPDLYRWVVNGRITSAYLAPRMQKRAGIGAMIIMWSMILLTIFFWVSNIWLRILLIALGITGTVFKFRYFFRNGKDSHTGNNQIA